MPSPSQALVILNAVPNRVENIIMVDPAAPIKLPSAQVVIYPGMAAIGWAWNGTIATPPPLPPSPVATYDTANIAVQGRLDTFAKSWGYDSLAAAVSYLSDPYAPYAAEAAALRDWRSQTWQTADPIIAALPTSPVTIDGLLGMLPGYPARPVV